MPTQSLFAKWPLWLRLAAPVLLLVTLSLIGGCGKDFSSNSLPGFYVAHLQEANAIWFKSNPVVLSTGPSALTIAGLPSGSSVTDLVALSAHFSLATTLYMVSSSAGSLVIATGPGPTGPFSVVATVKTGANPFGLAVDAFARFAYVTNTGDDSVTVIDLLLNQAVATIALPPGSQPDRNQAVRARDVCIRPFRLRHQHRRRFRHRDRPATESGRSHHCVAARQPTARRRGDAGRKETLRRQLEHRSCQRD